MLDKESRMRPQRYRNTLKLFKIYLCKVFSRLRSIHWIGQVSTCFYRFLLDSIISKQFLNSYKCFQERYVENSFTKKKSKKSLTSSSQQLLKGTIISRSNLRRIWIHSDPLRSGENLARISWRISVLLYPSLNLKLHIRRNQHS